LLKKQGETDRAAGSSWADLAETQQSIQWDWPGWLPRGFLVIVAGEPGTGKSALCLRLAASYGHRLPWPGGSKFSGKRGKIIWCDSENSQALKTTSRAKIDEEAWDVCIVKCHGRLPKRRALRFGSKFLN
jgi:KaiC/GvpD/RAD55 family RecA-like ATPase